jgi:hypothetical protein
MRQANNTTGAATGGAALDGAALEKALGEHKFDQATTQLIGMVKASANQAHVSFAPVGCEAWVDLPSAMIEKAEHIGHQSCKDHSHPVFRLSLKEPTDPQAKALWALLTARAPNSLSMPVMAPPNLAGFPGISRDTASFSAMRKPQCQTWCYGSTLMCACSVYVPGYGQGIIIYACGTCIDDPIFTAFA